MDDSTQTGALPVGGGQGRSVGPGTVAGLPAAPLPATGTVGAPATTGSPGTDDDADWSWPPYAPPPPADRPRFDVDEWAPSSIVRRPLVRVGRWTLLYRRGC